MTEESNKTHTAMLTADTAERLMLSLQPNISFVSEPCRGERENEKRLVGETEDEVK